MFIILNKKNKRLCFTYFWW